MNKQTNHTKYYLPILSLLVIGLTIIALSLIVTTYSKFVTSKIDDHKSAVAKFDVSEVLVNGGAEQILTVKLKPGEEITEYVSVTNSGDVLVKYTIEVINTTNNLPLTFTGSTNTIAPHTSDVTCEINISWPSSNNDPSYSGKVDVIKISIIVEQVVEGS